MRQKEKNRKKWGVGKNVNCEIETKQITKTFVKKKKTIRTKTLFTVFMCAEASKVISFEVYLERFLRDFVLIYRVIKWILAARLPDQKKSYIFYDKKGVKYLVCLSFNDFFHFIYIRKRLNILII